MQAKKLLSKIAAGAAAVAASSSAFAVDAATQIKAGEADLIANGAAVIGVVVIIAGIAWARRIIR